jgi:ribonuclease R
LARFQEASYEPLTQRELMHKWQVPGSLRSRVRRLFEGLLSKRKIARGRGGRLEPATRDNGPVVGKLSVVRGKPRVIPDNGDSAIEIPPRSLEGARDGDQVEARPHQRRDGQRFGRVLRIIERAQSKILAVHLGGDPGSVQPFEPAHRVPLKIDGGKRAKRRDVVEVELIPPRRRGSEETVKVLEILGGLDDPGMDVQVVARKYNLDESLPVEVMEAADELPLRISSDEKKRRERFDDPAPITIDGETAKDFDDAIAVIELPKGGFRLWVHIADVAHFVEPGGTIDIEAKRRGTSVYFPGRVLPMLPPHLSDDLCSLRPNVERLVQTVILDIDAAGEPSHVRFADGLIRSAARLTYTQVAAVIDGEKRPPGIPTKVLPMLHAANKLRLVLEARRRDRGSVDFDLPMPTILLDVEGMVTGIQVEARNHAHRLIEECMLVANEAVAGYLAKKDWPCMYRIHAAPDEAKVELLERFVASFGLRLRENRKDLQPTDVRDLIEALDGRPEQPVIAQMTLRSMKQAVYTPENDGHFGLASPTYCHFTSPIRRYPDLIVHRSLRACRVQDQVAQELPDVEQLDALGRELSTLERNAEQAEREIISWKKVALIKDHVGDRFDGVVTGVANFGLFVQLNHNQVEGMIRVESLGEEHFQFDAGSQSLTGSRSGIVWRLGQSLRIEVEGVDRIRQRVDFRLVQSARKKPARERSKRVKRR